MNKRKIILLATALCMVAILVAGGTLAYFTDADAKTNVFTVGNVQIDLKENYEQLSNLLPVTYDEKGERKPDNVVNKDVYVSNTGTELAYVRVHIAIPTILDDGDPDFDAGKNVLHFNAEKESYQNGFWNWSTTPAGNDNLTGNNMVDGEWNFYTTKIKTTVGEGENAKEVELDYNVYVVTYESILTKDATTLHYAMSQVYLDSKVTNADITKINETLGKNWKIFVAAEGAQAGGFATAFEALNTSFGIPGDYTVEWDAVEKYIDENPNT